MKNILKNKKYLMLFIIFICLSIILIGSPTVINTVKENIKKAEVEEITWRTYGQNGDIKLVLVTINNQEGISKIKDITIENSNFEIYANGKTSVSFDYKMIDKNTYKFEAEFLNGTSKIYTIEYEKPRIKAEYTLIDNVYVNKPDISGFVKDKTRYLYLDNNGNLVPGDWLTGEQPDDWYSYGLLKWANVYVENNGVDSYWVWIPRYCYKIDEERQFHGDELTAANERMDVKFVNVYDEYIDPQTGERISWETLQAQGYKLPEAFEWKGGETGQSIGNDVDTIIPGYWMSKYQLAELDHYIIDFTVSAKRNTLSVTNITTNTDKQIATYTYAVNGQISYPNTSSPTNRDLNNPNTGHETVNVTALDADGQIIGSMTKDVKFVEPNKPDLSGFDKDTTFYVYWDANGNEHNEVPLSQNPPAEWYDYSNSVWANVVTRNDNLESYFVWIPRYAYSLNQTTQRSNIQFLEGTSSDIPAGYKIPEAFSWIAQYDNPNQEVTQLTGYWMSKYQLGDVNSTPRMSTPLIASTTQIKVQDITGTLIDNAAENNINVKYEYYLDGIKQAHEGSNANERYTYNNLTPNTDYVVTIIARNRNTNEFIGATTQRISTIIEITPDLTSYYSNTDNKWHGFNGEQTYYVSYTKNGSDEEIEVVGNKIGQEAPNDWFDYSEQKWANIVVTDGTVQNGQITGETYKTYFVWIPRYEYKILPDQDISIARTSVNFIGKNITNENCTPGYKVPESFTWKAQYDEDKDVEIPGYWMSKYQLGE